MSFILLLFFPHTLSFLFSLISDLDFRETHYEDKSIPLGQQMLVSLIVEAHPRPHPDQFFLAKADEPQGSERNWTKKVNMEVRGIGYYGVKVAINPQESGLFKIVYECHATVEGKPVFTNSSDTFEVKVFCKYAGGVWP